LDELLKDEADARRTAETAQVEGIQAMWAKFQKTIANERDSYLRLEESKKALVSGNTINSYPSYNHSPRRLACPATRCSSSD